MPKIPSYQRQASITGEAAATPMPIGSSLIVGAAINRAGDDLFALAAERSAQLRKQQDDNFLINEGSKLNRAYTEKWVEIQNNPNLDYEGMKKEIDGLTGKQMAAYEQVKADRPELFNQIFSHASALQNSMVSNAASLASHRIRANGEAARKTDLESSLQLAGVGQNLETATTNYNRTLDAQEANGLISREEKALLAKDGNSSIMSAHLEHLAGINPQAAAKMYDAVKGALTERDGDRIERLVKPAAAIATGRDIGREVFRNNPGKDIETQINMVKDRKLDPDTENHAMQEVINSFRIREQAEKDRADNATKKVLSVLTPIALKRKDGLNRMDDLTPAQWAEYQRDNPEAAARMQDGIRREQQQALEIKKADVRWSQQMQHQREQENIQRQGGNENAMMLDPDFLTMNVDEAFARGDISREGRNRLIKLQQEADPMKRVSVQRAIRNLGKLQASLHLSDKGQLAIWEQRYAGLIKAFAYNHISSPTFDTDLTKYLEKYVYSDLVTGWLTTDETDRQTRFKEAQSVAGPLPQPTGKHAQPASTTLKIGDARKGYRYKGGDPSNKGNWEKM